MNNENLIESKIRETKDLLNLLNVASNLVPLGKQIKFYDPETGKHKFSMYTMMHRPLKLNDLWKTGTRYTHICHDYGSFFIDALRIVWHQEKPSFEYFNHVFPTHIHYNKLKIHWKMISNEMNWKLFRDLLKMESVKRI